MSFYTDIKTTLDSSILREEIDYNLYYKYIPENLDLITNDVILYSFSKNDSYDTLGNIDKTIDYNLKIIVSSADLDSAVTINDATKDYLIGISNPYLSISVVSDSVQDIEYEEDVPIYTLETNYNAIYESNHTFDFGALFNSLENAASISYVDGSLNKRDVSISNLDSSIQRLDFEPMIVSLSDLTTALDASTNKERFKINFNGKLIEVGAFVLLPPQGQSLITNIKKNDVSILSTRIFIDASEYSSSTSDTQPVIAADSSIFTIGDIISFDIDQIGSTTAGKGLKVDLKFKKL